MGDLAREKCVRCNKGSLLITLLQYLLQSLLQLNYLYISTLYYIVTNVTKYLSNKFKYNVD